MIKKHDHAVSQLQFTQTSHTLCSTACLVWVISLFKFQKEDFCTDHYVKQVLSFANELHQKIELSLNKRHEMISIDDIFSVMPSPIRVSMSEYYGHCLLPESSDCIAAIPNIIHRNKLCDLMKPSIGIIITCNAHNVAIFCRSDDELTLFDSMPACTYELNKDDLQICLSNIFRNMEEFNVFVLEQIH